MPSTAHQRINQPQDGSREYVRLENRLVMLAWLNGLLGYEKNRDLLADTRDISEGFMADGRSHLYHHLISRSGVLKIAPDDLARYDENIRAHLAAINRFRKEPIVLRYFQHLAALYTEIFLDRFFTDRAQLLRDLNAFVTVRNATRSSGEPQDELFTESDLAKRAYWMATGSGKTLLLHLNYYQYLHYCREPLNNILLITPNEGLSDQHVQEFAASGIYARRFDPSTSGQLLCGRDAVQVIEITKLVEEKRGGGVRVPVESFEGPNLIFVDEGHKGSGGVAWRRYRDALGRTGFTFEYSATFGQALSASRNDPLTAEYGKAILFNYSYPYFYGDGFGKDFRILNLEDEVAVDKTETLLMGNLLGFYEQLRVFDEQVESVRPYNLERPLWVFVGSTVNAVYTENKKPRSDVLTVVRFFHHLLKNRSWAVESIKKIMDGDTGLLTQDGVDLFRGRLSYLREGGLSPQTVYDDMLDRVFHAPAAAGLHLCLIKNSDGELGLKAAGADEYFGLIYIGDTGAFRRLVEDDNSGVGLDEDAIATSPFERIGRFDSGINVLVGAKKFMEGWNSWRVASMGLLNIGREEGSQIIQLFGRGVRLRGKGLSLKRSSALPGSHPPHLPRLETLNVFAVRASYMARFRQYLEREGVETEPAIQLAMPVRTNEQFLRRGLLVPRPPEGCSHVTEASLVLEPDETLHVRVDVSAHVQVLGGTGGGLYSTEARSWEEHEIPLESLDLVEWDQVYLHALAHKERRGLANLVISPTTPRKIIERIPCTIVADETVLRPRSFEQRMLLQDAVTKLVLRYIDAFYRVRRERWEESTLVYRSLDRDDPNLALNYGQVRDGSGPSYVVRVSGTEKRLIRDIEGLLKAAEQLYERESDELPRIYFDRHLYLPLLLGGNQEIALTPPGLRPSEARFVRDLKEYWDTHSKDFLFGKEIYLLRNLTRGRGIGFFEERGFYPDFILWLVDRGRQRIVFVEPHGMVHAQAYIHDEKARLHERLPELAEEIGRRSNRQDVQLDAYIISCTPYDQLRKVYDDGTWDRAKFAERHILFVERKGDYDYVERVVLGTR